MIESINERGTPGTRPSLLCVSPSPLAPGARAARGQDTLEEPRARGDAEEQAAAGLAEGETLGESTCGKLQSRREVDTRLER